jgi:hypothetical protein
MKCYRSKIECLKCPFAIACEIYLDVRTKKKEKKVLNLARYQNKTAGS